MEIADKVRSQIVAGFTRTEICENLKEDGYSQSEITECLKNIEKTQRIKKYKVNRYVLTIGIAAVIYFFGRLLGSLKSINDREELIGQNTSHSTSMIILFAVLGGASLIGVILYSLRKK